MSFTIDPQGVETRVISDLVDFNGLRVLEVGCGDGRMTWRFAEKASSVLAVDVNDEKIEAAKWATPDDWRSKVENGAGLPALVWVVGDEGVPPPGTASVAGLD